MANVATIPLPLMSADQISRVVVAFTYADDPGYVANQLRAHFDLSAGQWIALRELAKLEAPKRAALAAEAVAS